MERAIIAGFGSAKHGEFSYQGYFDRGSHPTANAECDLSIITFTYLYPVLFPVVFSRVWQQSGGNLFEISLFIRRFRSFSSSSLTSFSGPNVACPMSYGLCGEDPEG